jgi:hypothetical protein
VKLAPRAPDGLLILGRKPAILAGFFFLQWRMIAKWARNKARWERLSLHTDAYQQYNHGVSAMKNMLVISGLAFSLMAGTALAQVNLGAEGSVDLGVNAGAATNGGTVDADLNTNASATADVESDDDLDAQTTAAVGAQGSVSAVLGTFEDEGASFFTDETRAEVRSQAEIETAFAQLSSEQQASLRAACADGTASGGSEIAGEAGLCAAINQMTQ